MIRRALLALLLLTVSLPAAAQTASRDISAQFARFGPPTALDEKAIDEAFARVRPELAGLTVVIVGC